MPHASLQKCDFKSKCHSSCDCVSVYVAAFICYCREHKPKKSIYSINATPYQKFGDKCLEKSGEEKRRHGWSLNGPCFLSVFEVQHELSTRMRLLVLVEFSNALVGNIGSQIIPVRFHYDAIKTA